MAILSSKRNRNSAVPCPYTLVAGRPGGNKITRLGGKGRARAILTCVVFMVTSAKPRSSFTSSVALRFTELRVSLPNSATIHLTFGRVPFHRFTKKLVQRNPRKASKQSGRIRLLFLTGSDNLRMVVLSSFKREWGHSFELLGMSTPLCSIGSLLAQKSDPQDKELPPPSPLATLHPSFSLLDP